MWSPCQPYQLLSPLGLVLSKELIVLVLGLLLSDFPRLLGLSDALLVRLLVLEQSGLLFKGQVVAHLHVDIEPLSCYSVCHFIMLIEQCQAFELPPQEMGRARTPTYDTSRPADQDTLHYSQSTVKQHEPLLLSVPNSPRFNESPSQSRSAKHPQSRVSSLKKELSFQGCQRSQVDQKGFKKQKAKERGRVAQKVKITERIERAEKPRESLLSEERLHQLQKSRTENQQLKAKVKQLQQCLKKQIINGQELRIKLTMAKKKRQNTDRSLEKNSLTDKSVSQEVSFEHTKSKDLSKEQQLQKRVQQLQLEKEHLSKYIDNINNDFNAATLRNQTLQNEHEQRQNQMERLTLKQQHASLRHKAKEKELAELVDALQKQTKQLHQSRQYFRKQFEQQLEEKDREVKKLLAAKELLQGKIISLEETLSLQSSKVLASLDHSKLSDRCLQLQTLHKSLSAELDQAVIRAEQAQYQLEATLRKLKEVISQSQILRNENQRKAISLMENQVQNQEFRRELQQLKRRVDMVNRRDSSAGRSQSPSPVKMRHQSPAFQIISTNFMEEQRINQEQKRQEKLRIKQRQLYLFEQQLKSKEQSLRSQQVEEVQLKSLRDQLRILKKAQGRNMAELHSQISKLEQQILVFRTQYKNKLNQAAQLHGRNLALSCDVQYYKQGIRSALMEPNHMQRMLEVMSKH